MKALIPVSMCGISSKLFKFIGSQPGLVENTSQCALRNIEAVPRDNGHARSLRSSFEKFYVTAALADFDESGSLKPASDLPERQRPKA